MATAIKLPEIADGVESATVSEILVSEGDTIKKDQPIAAMESDKAAVEVPASTAGTVREIMVSEGDEVKIGATLLSVEEAEKSSDQPKDDEEKAGEAQKEEEEPADTETGKEPEKEEAPSKSRQKTTSAGGADIPAAPAVRRLAREKDVDLKKVEGTGPEGRILQEDVQKYAEGGTPPAVGAPQLKLPDFSKWGPIEKQKLTVIRKTTANKVTGAWQHIPHVFQFEEADISGVQNFIDEKKKKTEKAGGKMTLTAILTKLTAFGLRKFPKFNASIDLENEEMILKHYVHIGIAVATDQGLLMPVLQNVDKKNVIDLAVEISEIAQKARDRKLTTEEMQGGNFSISNLGGIGGTNFTPIIYHPQSAILGVSRTKTKPVWIDGAFKPRPILPFSLSYDHRLIDGAEAAAFVGWLKKALEDPFEAMMG